ncbi:MAG: di-trans,poly-cis-decaprenylcistransferase [Bacteroidales bacterium]|nr:di-trans,poly-cis-decaprenylcistransferase [Bacteroidales bacterium]
MDLERSKPTHVAIIMDGNGRWAAQRGMDRVCGHAEGVESVRACVEAAAEEGVRYLSLFAFSEENWGRSDEEVGALMGLMLKAIEEEVPALMENNVRLLFLGNRERLDAELNASIENCVERTSGNTGLTLIVFVSYSGKWDVLQAVRRLVTDCAEHPEMLDKVREMGVEDFGDFLVTAGVPDPDLIIRTSGERRLSNFLLWQGAYSELYFTPTLWPDFRKEDFRKALKDYAGRERRYGKV